MLRSLFFIDKIGHQHIQSLVPVHKPAQHFQNLLVGLPVHPVIAVHHLKIDTGRSPQPGIDRLSMSAVFLMNGPANSRIFCLIFIRDLAGPILFGTVIHNQNLHRVPPGKQ